MPPLPRHVRTARENGACASHAFQEDQQQQQPQPPGGDADALSAAAQLFLVAAQQAPKPLISGRPTIFQLPAVILHQPAPATAAATPAAPPRPPAALPVSPAAQFTDMGTSPVGFSEQQPTPAGQLPVPVPYVDDRPRLRNVLS